ncbi:hypothetical protein BY458DRAFT_495194 [Sporodiniella umbellata]|nr:hypothetical protein BY458DRAFT_495194 [Sporodiniella umbellata]
MACRQLEVRTHRINQRSQTRKSQEASKPEDLKRNNLLKVASTIEPNSPDFGQRCIGPCRFYWTPVLFTRGIQRTETKIRTALLDGNNVFHDVVLPAIAGAIIYRILGDTIRRAVLALGGEFPNGIVQSFLNYPGGIPYSCMRASDKEVQVVVSSKKKKKKKTSSWQYPSANVVPHETIFGRCQELVAQVKARATVFGFNFEIFISHLKSDYAYFTCLSNYFISSELRVNHPSRHMLVQHLVSLASDINIFESPVFTFINVATK